MEYKRFLLWQDLGSYEGWKLRAQAETWADLVAAWKECIAAGGYGSVIMTEYIPLVLEDGRPPRSPAHAVPGHPL